MYVPVAFSVSDLSTLHEFIEQHSFGLLVSAVNGVPFASHLPLLLDRAVGSKGTLIGHMARANPQWRELEGPSALVVVSGPHAYVSPTWYEAENVVPTWNYTAVHAYGPAELVEDEESLLEIVRRSVATYEAGLPKPWSFDPENPFVRRLLGQIVGFRISIERLEGKFKLNQNHPPERREKVAQRLRDWGGENALAIAAMMDDTPTPSG